MPDVSEHADAVRDAAWAIRGCYDRMGCDDPWPTVDALAAAAVEAAYPHIAAQLRDDAEAYRLLRDRIVAVMPDDWDDDAAEEDVLARYVEHLAADRAAAYPHIAAEVLRAEADRKETYVQVSDHERIERRQYVHGATSRDALRLRAAAYELQTTAPDTTDHDGSEA